MNVVFAIASGKVVCAMSSNQTSYLVRASRGNVMTGALPDDFLRIDDQQIATSAAIGQSIPFGGFQPAGGVLTITIVQARLAKNYGMTRMDPYCRIMVGMQVFETPTAYNGSKTPRWNKIVQCQLPESVREFYFEILDERTFQVDEKIAWGMITIKEEVLNGETVDEWYSLTGKQGDEKEGLVNIILQYRKSTGPVFMGSAMFPSGVPVMYPAPVMYPGVMYGYPQQVMYAPPSMQQYPQQTGIVQQQQQQQQQAPPVSQNDLQTLKEMCPNMDDDIIRTVLQQSSGNMDRAAAQLLEMSAGQ